MIYIMTYIFSTSSAIKNYFKNFKYRKYFYSTVVYPKMVESKQLGKYSCILLTEVLNKRNSKTNFHNKYTNMIVT